MLALSGPVSLERTRNLKMARKTFTRLTASQAAAKFGTPSITKVGATSLEEIEAILDDGCVGSEEQVAIWKEMLNGRSNLLVDAKAGTGKTFTVIRRGLRLLSAAGKLPKYTTVMAFNAAIADELKAVVPEGVFAATSHGVALRNLRRWNPRWKVEGGKSHELLEELVGGPEAARQFDTITWNAIVRVVGLVKNLLAAKVTLDCDGSPENVSVDKKVLEQIEDRYGIVYVEDDDEDVADKIDAARELVGLLLLEGLKSDLIDFDDMLWYPSVFNVKFFEVDLLVVDEAQDLNPAQHDLVKRCSGSRGRVIVVGDPNQSIYGFRGADIDSMGTLQRQLGMSSRGVCVLPLAMTRRCPKSHVRLAQKLVPEFGSLPDAIEGTIKTVEEVEAEYPLGSLVVSRTNAPAISIAFRLIGRGVKATVMGRDIGKQLTGLMRKLEKNSEGTMKGFKSALEAWYNTHYTTLLKKRGNEKKIEQLQDRYACVGVFVSDKFKTPAEAIQACDDLFSDKVSNGVTCSTVHRAKGLEAETVIVLYPEDMPHPSARTQEDRQQERNIEYVAITRSKKHLVFVKKPKKKEEFAD